MMCLVVFDIEVSSLDLCPSFIVAGHLFKHTFGQLNTSGDLLDFQLLVDHIIDECSLCIGGVSGCGLLLPPVRFFHFVIGRHVYSLSN